MCQRQLERFLIIVLVVVGLVMSGLIVSYLVFDDLYPPPDAYETGNGMR